MTLRKFICILALLAALPAAGCSPEPQGPSLGIVALKVGKADAIILYTENSAVLIDSGEDDDGDKVIEAARERNIDKFDYMILTHYDKDHVGGAAELIGGMEIAQIIEPGYSKDSEQYNAYVAAADSAGIPRTVPEGDVTLELDGAVYQVYMPKQGEYEDENDHSIVVKVAYGGCTALFTGDALDVRTAELAGYDISADLLKVPHHGSYESGSEAFFARVSPEYAVIPCSSKNPADGAAVSALEELGCKVYTTAEGHVEFALAGGQVSAP